MNLVPGDIAFFKQNISGVQTLWSHPFERNRDLYQTSIRVSVECALCVVAVVDHPEIDGWRRILDRSVLVVGGGSYGWTMEASLRET